MLSQGRIVRHIHHPLLSILLVTLAISIAFGQPSTQKPTSKGTTILQPESQSYPIILNLNQYYSAWAQLVPPQSIHNVTHLATGKQICNNASCQFFFYEVINEELGKEDLTVQNIQNIVKDQQNKAKPLKNGSTMFLLSGLHGNQYIAPNILLQSIKHLRAYRIIYFPMANPSGFIRRVRDTYPNNCKTNRDFPIDGNTQCYQCSSTHIIDYIFRTFSIDLTVAIHNGGNEIAFNWGTEMHKSASHTIEYPIYYQIASMMKYYGGYNSKCGMKQFNIGTMTQVIYSAKGTFDDWAYGVSKYPEAIQKTCKIYNYESYPSNMMHGLMFLIEAGMVVDSFKCLGSPQGINLQPTNDTLQNGYISRVVRLLVELCYVLNPTIEAIVTKQNIYFKVRGCASITIVSIVIKPSPINTLDKVYKLLNQTTNYTGSVTNHGIPVHKISISEQLSSFLTEGQDIFYQIFGDCDTEWNNLGSTTFSQPRSTFVKQKTKIMLENSQALQEFKQGQEILSENKSFIQYTVLVIILCFIVGVLFRICQKAWEKIRRKRILDFQLTGFEGEAVGDKNQQSDKVKTMTDENS